MLEKFTSIDITDFTKESLKKLKPFFGISTISCGINERHLWFYNLLHLSKYSLGLAHCVQHNHTARLHLESKFVNGNYPEFFDPTYENTIGCYSNYKSPDNIFLGKNQITGTKFWLSMADLADYGVFKIPTDNNRESYVVIDFHNANPYIKMDNLDPLGMKIARPGSVTLNRYDLPECQILGYRTPPHNAPEFFHLYNLHDYCFITNYVGLITALFGELKIYSQVNKLSGLEFNLQKIELDISMISIAWQDNLSTVDITESTDKFWNKRHTQYILGKNVLLNLINLILQVCDSRWLDASSSATQRFRDALTFCSHMKPLHGNLHDRILFTLDQ